MKGRMVTWLDLQFDIADQVPPMTSFRGRRAPTNHYYRNEEQEYGKLSKMAIERDNVIESALLYE